MAHILLVDDNTPLLNVLKEALEIGEHAVSIAHSGADALATLHDGLTPDAILCDIMMPDMDGITFLRHVRAHPHHQHIFFIAMSGNGGDRIPVLEAGANEYLPKPFAILDLLALIERQV